MRPREAVAVNSGAMPADDERVATAFTPLAVHYELFPILQVTIFVLLLATLPVPARLVRQSMHSDIAESIAAIS